MYPLHVLIHSFKHPTNHPCAKVPTTLLRQREKIGKTRVISKVSFPLISDSLWLAGFCTILIRSFSRLLIRMYSSGHHSTHFHHPPRELCAHVHTRKAGCGGMVLLFIRGDRRHASGYNQLYVPSPHTYVLDSASYR